MSTLSPETIAIIKSTVPVLKEHGQAITTHFYKRMFQNHPELKNIFNQTNQAGGRQPAALAHAVYASAVHIDNLEVILPAIQGALHKHVSLGITPEQYSIVGENLLAAIKETLGAAATDEIINSWAEAYGIIANIFITLEKQLYEQSKNKAGGWEGFVPFVVVTKNQTSETATSIELKPKHSDTLIDYSGGQYITIRAEIPNEELIHCRQYSLSKAYDGFTLQITPRKDGKVSGWLIDQVQVGDELYITPPAGPFKRIVGAKKHVFIAGGIGITPLISMAQEALAASEPLEFVYCIGSKADAHLLPELQEIEEKGPENKVQILSKDKDIPKSQKEWFSVDFMKKSMQCLQEPEAIYYTCGSPDFINQIVRILREAGIKESQIQFEPFGPAIAI